MHLSKIRLYNFRNFTEADVSFSPGINIIYGENAQGKTNMLEAVYFLACLKSDRASKESEMIRYDHEQTYLKGLFETEYGPVEREITLHNGGKKSVKENEITVRRWSMLCQEISAIFFSPDDLSLVKGEPSQRRRFLDNLIFQLKPVYLGYVKDYNRVLSQRNTLLKTIKKNPSLISSLDPWDEQLARLGAYIIRERLEGLQKIALEVKELYSRFTDGKVRLQVNYMNSVKYDNMDSLKMNFHKALLANRHVDISRSFTTLGPHRDDLRFLIDGRDMKYFGSQGQQRLLVLCFKLCQRELLYRERGQYPIMILDDVMSELDYNRRKHILDKHKSQVFITTTDMEQIPEEIKAQSSLYHMVSGKIR